MSPSWGRIRVASSRSGLTLCSVVLIQILQPWGSTAEWKGPAKMGMATFVSHACHSLNSALFVMVAEGCLSQQHLEATWNALLVGYSSLDTFRVGWAETSLIIGEAFCLLRHNWICTLSMHEATSNVKHQTAMNIIARPLCTVLFSLYNKRSSDVLHWVQMGRTHGESLETSNVQFLDPGKSYNVFTLYLLIRPYICVLPTFKYICLFHILKKMGFICMCI